MQNEISQQEELNHRTSSICHRRHPGTSQCRKLVNGHGAARSEARRSSTDTKERQKFGLFEQRIFVEITLNSGARQPAAIIICRQRRAQ